MLGCESTPSGLLRAGQCRARGGGDERLVDHEQRRPRGQAVHEDLSDARLVIEVAHSSLAFDCRRTDMFQAQLLDEGIELPIVALPGHGTFIRISAHVYNRLADYDRLADALLARGIRGRAL